MAGKGLKLGVTYAVTILATLLIIGGVGFFIAYNFLFAPKDNETEEESVGLNQLADENEYVPSDADKRTLLVILDTEKRNTASGFMIIKLLPVEKKLMMLTLPSDTAVVINGKEGTLYDYYKNGGSAAAVTAVENCTGLDIDKYIKFSKNSFETLVDIFGGVDYYVPYNLVYSNTETGEETVIREGKTTLDASTMRKIMTYPNYTSGEEYRAKCSGIIISEMLNATVDEDFSTHINDYFNTIINSDVETNITSYDYEEISKALKYVIVNTDKLADFLPATGDYKDGKYVLDEMFVKSLSEYFKTYDDISSDDTSSDDTSSDGSETENQTGLNKTE